MYPLGPRPFSGSLRYCGVSLPVILSFALNLGSWEEIQSKAQNDKQLMSAVTPQYLKEPLFVTGQAYCNVYRYSDQEDEVSRQIAAERLQKYLEQSEDEIVLRRKTIVNWRRGCLGTIVAVNSHADLHDLCD